MKQQIKIIGLFLLLISHQIVFAQTNQEKAFEKGLDAVKKMDSGQIEESIKLLEEAQVLDPDKFDYPYELAYAYYLKQDFEVSIKILEKLINHKNVNQQLFQLLGNSYDILGKTDEAFEAYDKGLELFPNSGIIYLEKGNVFWGQKEYNKALSFYEKGIELDPQFPSNYYRATLLYCSSSEVVWGLIYGEIFMNLERNSKRTAEISKLLFDTYKSNIKFIDDSTISVSFCKDMTININSITDEKKFNLPFCMIFEPTFLMSFDSEKSIEIKSLNNIRTNFVENYFLNKRDEMYPNVLFSYQKNMLDAGHLEAYNHWILMKGDEAEFDAWYGSNPAKWNAFIEWFKINGLVLNQENRFYSAQYQN
uniref:tetratricopeptide repeat protein n=1 Tax=Flavobacterium sp. TaxID=239 RepID=UPI00404967A9